jgi:hypothetical protein
VERDSLLAVVETPLGKGTETEVLEEWSFRLIRMLASRMKKSKTVALPRLKSRLLDVQKLGDLAIAVDHSLKKIRQLGRTSVEAPSSSITDNNCRSKSWERRIVPSLLRRFGKSYRLGKESMKDQMIQNLSEIARMM